MSSPKSSTSKSSKQVAPKVGRPFTGGRSRSKQLTVRLSDKESEQLASTLKARKQTASALIRELITPYLQPPVVGQSKESNLEETILVQLEKNPVRLTLATAKDLLKQLTDALLK